MVELESEGDGAEGGRREDERKEVESRRFRYSWSRWPSKRKGFMVVVKGMKEMGWVVDKKARR